VGKRNSRGETPGEPGSPSAPTDTLHRIVNAKEEAQRRWEEEQEEFRKRQRDHEIKMIEIEQAEVDRRQKEVQKLNFLHDDTRRKNQQIQDKIVEQIEILKGKLEEYKIEHENQETSILEDIASKTDLLFTVQESLDRRKKTLEIDLDEDNYKIGSLYPTIEITTTDGPNMSGGIASNQWDSELKQSPQLSNDSIGSNSSDSSV